MKFSYAHFPKGTIFEASDMIAKMHDGLKQYEVVAVRRNGPASYVLETTHSKELKTPIYDEQMEPTGEYKTEILETVLNISHVDKIIKRGNGPAKISNMPPIPPLPGSGSIHKGRRSYASYFGFTRHLHRLVDVYVPSDACIDIDALSQYIMHHAAIRTVDRGGDGYRSVTSFIRKKKLHRIVRQNVNRFLVSPRKVQDEDDADIARMMEEDFDREHDLLDAALSDEGSCYGEDEHARVNPMFEDDPALDEQFALRSADFDDHDHQNPTKLRRVVSATTAGSGKDPAAMQTLGDLLRSRLSVSDDQDFLSRPSSNCAEDTDL